AAVFEVATAAAGNRQGLAIGREGERRNRHGLTRQSVLQIPGLCIPQDDLSPRYLVVFPHDSTRREELAVRRERHSHDPTLVSLQCPEHFSRFHVPDLHRLVTALAHKRLAVRGKDDPPGPCTVVVPDL